MTIWTCLCQGDVLLTTDGRLPQGEQPPVPLHPWNSITSIQHDKAEVKVIRLDAPIVGVKGLQMINLRASFDILDAESYTIAGKAAELIYWDQNTRYCGCCGGEMRFHTEISKRCCECGKEVWPQLATAIIVRVTRIGQLDNLQLDNCCTQGACEEGCMNHDISNGCTQELSNCKSSICPNSEVLLVHANNFRGDYYGLVAGFVETGETLEDCVRREVREETGIEVKNIRYFASQPWPYPCGLMVGFTAEYAGGELHLQRSELSAGGWFTRDKLPQIPGRVSLARRLIDDWLQPHT